tara:strand:+ start:7488 stop:9122 length:1635 start_codon:yes stop_codon:yes gene_type:complete
MNLKNIGKSITGEKTICIFNPSSTNFNGKKYTIARGEDYKNSPPPRGHFNGQSTYWLKEDSGEYVKLKFNIKGKKIHSYIKKDVNPDYKFPEDIRFIHGAVTIENGDIIALATCTIINQTICHDEECKKVSIDFSAGHCSVNLSKLEITNIKKFDSINQINPNKNWMSFKYEDLFYVIYSMFPLIYTTAQKLENISFNNINLDQNINLRNSCNPINIQSNEFIMLCHERRGEYEYKFNKVSFEIIDKEIIIKEKKEINPPEDKSYCCSLEKEGTDIFVLCGVHDRYCSRFKINPQDKANLLVLYTQFDSNKYPHSFKILSDALYNKGIDFDCVVIDNKREGLNKFQGKKISIIPGNNLNWEFSGWQKGFDESKGKHYDLILITNDSFLNYNTKVIGKHLNQDLLNVLKKHDLVFGKIDGLNLSEKNFSLDNAKFNNWICSNAIIIPNKILQKIKLDNSSEIKIDSLIQDENELNSFLNSSRISSDLKNHIINWLTKGWHSKFKIESNVKLFKKKTQCIINELLLTSKIKNAGAKILNSEDFKLY